MKVEAMPILMVGKYIPEICETAKSRAAFISKMQSKQEEVRWPESGIFRAKLYRAPDSGGRFYYFAIADNDLQYLMHLNPLVVQSDLDVDKPVYQGSVWRAEGSVQYIGRKLPSWVFWHLHETHDMMSDSIQSADGKRFWENRIDEALEKHLKVYAVHYHEEGKLIVDDYQQLKRGMPIQHYWTHEAKQDLSGAYWRFLIKQS